MQNFAGDEIGLLEEQHRLDDVMDLAHAPDRVQAGERIGLIKFGSRVDVIFGPEWSIEVTPGMRVIGGSSVLARRAGEVVLTETLAATLVEEAALCRT